MGFRVHLVHCEGAIVTEDGHEGGCFYLYEVETVEDRKVDEAFSSLARHGFITIIIGEWDRDQGDGDCGNMCSS